MSWKSIWIYLKSQNKFWNLKIWFKSENPAWKFISNMDLQSGSMCMYSTLSFDKIECIAQCTWHHSVGSMFEMDENFSDWIQMDFQEIKVLGMIVNIIYLHHSTMILTYIHFEAQLYIYRTGFRGKVSRETTQKIFKEWFHQKLLQWCWKLDKSLIRGRP